MNGKRTSIEKIRGFTLIELLVVLAIISLLLTIALPRYFGSVERSKEAVLRTDISVMRDALDKYYSDNGKYPDTLDDMVSKKYLRAIPLDPITESSATWIIIPPDDSSLGAVFNIKSGAPGNGRNGIPFSEW